MRRALAIGLVAALGWAAPAAAAGPVPGIAERADAWLSRTLGAPARNLPLEVGDTTDCAGDRWAAARGMTCAALAYEDHITLAPDRVRALWMVAETHDDQEQVGHLLLHELLHRWHADRDLEEMAVDAEAIDLYPAWARSEGISFEYPIVPLYPEVAHVRTASARATGTSWRSRAARLWRRALWATDDTGRASMWAAAFNQETTHAR